MKKTILNFLFVVMLSLPGAILFTSCGQKEHKEHEGHEDTEVTEEVHEHDGDHHDSDTTLTYACPMHPEEKGKEGDTCSKCKMALEKIETQTETEVEAEKTDEQ